MRRTSLPAAMRSRMPISRRETASLEDVFMALVRETES